MSRYRKIEVRTWGDERFRALSSIPPCGQGLWLYLLTGPHTGPIPGLFRAGRAALAEELGWDLKAFDKALKELTDKGMVKVDAAARVMWIPNAVRHNGPESPNVVKGWGKEFGQLPESHLKDEALASIQSIAEGFGEAFQKAFREAFREHIAKQKQKGFRQVFANQEQEQEQERYPSQDTDLSGQAGASTRANGSAYAFDDTDPLGRDGEAPR